MIYLKAFCLAGLWLVLSAWAQAYLYPSTGPRQLELYAIVELAITIGCVLIWRFAARRDRA